MPLWLNILLLVLLLVIVVMMVLENGHPSRTLAWILAIVTRLLLTGCLHEDGLADFIDGFGGGTTRERTLAIMKDSHIGTYGVIGLIVYFALLLQLPATLSRDTLILAVLCGDCWSKCCAAQLINFLPYARTEETAKNKTVYARMKLGELIQCFFFGLAPAFILTFALHWMPVSFLWLLFVPLGVMLLLALLMRRKIQGYTGDCCGATFLLCELSFYLSVLIYCSIGG